jgi:hypothetical protein
MDTRSVYALGVCGLWYPPGEGDFYAYSNVEIEANPYPFFKSRPTLKRIFPEVDNVVFHFGPKTVPRTNLVPKVGILSVV